VLFAASAFALASLRYPFHLALVPMGQVKFARLNDIASDSSHCIDRAAQDTSLVALLRYRDTKGLVAGLSRGPPCVARAEVFHILWNACQW
jgi:hypothetical protein